MVIMCQQCAKLYPEAVKGVGPLIYADSSFKKKKYRGGKE